MLHCVYVSMWVHFLSPSLITLPLPLSIWCLHRVSSAGCVCVRMHVDIPEFLNISTCTLCCALLVGIRSPPGRHITANISCTVIVEYSWSTVAHTVLAKHFLEQAARGYRYSTPWQPLHQYQIEIPCEHCQEFTRPLVKGHGPPFGRPMPRPLVSTFTHFFVQIVSQRTKTSTVVWANQQLDRTRG